MKCSCNSRDSVVSSQTGLHLEKYVQTKVLQTYRKTIVCLCLCWRECTPFEWKGHIQNSRWLLRCVMGTQKTCHTLTVSCTLRKQLCTMFHNMYPDVRGGLFGVHGPLFQRNGRMSCYLAVCFSVNGMLVTNMLRWGHKKITIHPPNLPEWDNVHPFQQFLLCRYVSIGMCVFGDLPACFAHTNWVVSLCWNNKYWNATQSICSLYLP